MIALASLDAADVGGEDARRSVLGAEPDEVVAGVAGDLDDLGVRMRTSPISIE